MKTDRATIWSSSQGTHILAGTCARVLGLERPLTGEARLSNARLHGTGFQFRYPTIREGVPALVQQWLETRKPG